MKVLSSNTETYRTGLGVALYTCIRECSFRISAGTEVIRGFPEGRGDWWDMLQRNHWPFGSSAQHNITA
jgi:hypothetical protein